MDRDLSFNYLHPARTTGQFPQNLLRPSNKGISDCGCSGNIAASYGLGGLGGLGMDTLMNNGVVAIATRPLGGLLGLGEGEGQVQETQDSAGRMVYRVTPVAGIWMTVSFLSGLISAYHGYKRNGNSIGWGLGWYFLGAWFPVIVPIGAYLQGYAKPIGRSGVSGFSGRMKRALGKARARSRRRHKR